MTWAIAAREAGALFRSPAAWVVLAAVQAVTAFIFLLHLESYLQLQPRLQASGSGPGVTAFLVPRLFGAATSIHMLVVPLLTMNLLAGDRRDGVLPLLASAPVSAREVILGKYLGVMSLLTVMVGLTVLMPATLAAVTDLDLRALALAALGALLFVAAAAAAGAWFSTLAHNPAVAAMATLGLLLGLLLLGEWGRGFGADWAAVLAYPAPATHLAPFFRGLLDSGAVAFFVLFTGLFLTLAVRRLDNERLRG